MRIAANEKRLSILTTFEAIPLGLSPMISNKLKVAKAKPNRFAIEFFI
jgi:hypothetical protein